MGTPHSPTTKKLQFPSSSVPSSMATSTPTPPVDIVVIGAGISGISAAYYCSKGGYRVKILERRENVGGKCSNKIYDAT